MISAHGTAGRRTRIAEGFAERRKNAQSSVDQLKSARSKVLCAVQPSQDPNRRVPSEARRKPRPTSERRQIDWSAWRTAAAIRPPDVRFWRPPRGAAAGIRKRESGAKRRGMKAESPAFPRPLLLRSRATVMTKSIRESMHPLDVSRHPNCRRFSLWRTKKRVVVPETGVNFSFPFAHFFFLTSSSRFLLLETFGSRRSSCRNLKHVNGGV